MDFPLGIFVARVNCSIAGHAIMTLLEKASRYQHKESEKFTYLVHVIWGELKPRRCQPSPDE